MIAVPLMTHYRPRWPAHVSRRWPLPGLRTRALARVMGAFPGRFYAKGLASRRNAIGKAQLMLRSDLHSGQEGAQMPSLESFPGLGRRDGKNVGWTSNSGPESR